MRQRAADEKDIRLYCNERVRETVYLQEEGTAGWWSPANRKAIQDAQRSSYLDSLQKLAAEGRFGFLGKDAALLDVILDPNLIIYSRWKLNDALLPGTTWRDHLGQIESQKLVEAGNLSQRLEKLMPGGGKVGYSHLLQLAQALAEECGFRCVLLEKGSKPRIVIEARLTDHLSMYLEWEDYYLLRTRGDMELRFVIREPGTAVWDRKEKAPFFCASLGNLIPGGESYLNTHGEWNLVALSLFAHMDFMRSVAAA